jgi:hypothetical protein
MTEAIRKIPKPAAKRRDFCGMAVEREASFEKRRVFIFGGRRSGASP